MKEFIGEDHLTAKEMKRGIELSSGERTFYLPMTALEGL